MTQAVLLDLGNVVLGVDFRNVFRHWAASANIDEERFFEHWRMDAAYEAHERGELPFEDYAEHLAGVFDVELTRDQWLAGWNAIWTEPFQQVISMLPEVAKRYPLYCFTNTNDAHTLHWRHHYAEAISHFQHTFVSSELGMRKPDVSAFHYVCAEMQQPPSNILFLDDTQTNVDGAHAAGLNAKHVRNESEVVAELAQLLK